ncbi:AsnC family transcriptional regulator [Roseovarius autotrophicus]|uniref:siroheme decarboxylase subunit beta n=1 Tax=Roseovarius autotrophicus TaxID=2824121 RepID=UPI001A08B11B|nr:AsnC family transcriptional regulator [Roseovarius autotrophicus]MBE0452727.1 AsnC family transcriptional regulator [Roseovarius sp.]
MPARLDPRDTALLDRFQRDLPLVSRPFAVMAGALGLTEAEVIERLARLSAEGKIARVGATVRPNTAGASTLAALGVAAQRLEEVAEIVGQEPGVNHSYQRDHAWNLWFVATAADGAELQATLDRIAARTGREVLDLRLVRAFNIDLGFPLQGVRPVPRRDAPVDRAALCDGDRPLLHLLSQGLPLVPVPYTAAARDLGMSEAAVIARIGALLKAGILTRLGVIVRHRSLGWAANAMVTFDLPEDRMEAAGRALAAHPGVTLCYQRRTVPGVWPYGLFCMIHGRSRAEALATLDVARALPELRGAAHQVLFSQRCFKQTGARLLPSEAA